MVRKDPIFEARTNVKVSGLPRTLLPLLTASITPPMHETIANLIFPATLQQTQERSRPSGGDLQIRKGQGRQSDEEPRVPDRPHSRRLRRPREATPSNPQIRSGTRRCHYQRTQGRPKYPRHIPDARYGVAGPRRCLTERQPRTPRLPR